MAVPPPGASPSHRAERRSSCCLYGLSTFSILVPVAAAAILCWIEPMDPSPMPIHELTQQPVAAMPTQDGHMLQQAQLIGVGRLLGPEDITYDPESRIIYTGCLDGWIKRVSVGESASDSVVENWVFVGGRPLGLTLGPNKEVLVTNPDKGISPFWEAAVRYPLIRKGLAALERHKLLPNTAANGGVLAVDLTGKPTAHYSDPSMFLISSGLKIGNRLYCGSVTFPYLITLNLTQYTARADSLTWHEYRIHCTC